MEDIDDKRTRVMPILFFGVLVAALDIAIVGPSLRSIGAYFGVGDERLLAWVFIMYTLFTQVGIPFMSWLSDAYGRRFAYSLCMGLFASGLVVVVLSSSFEMLLVGRAIQGLGVSGVVPITSAVIGDLYPVEKRGRMLGIIGAVFGLAFIIGPIMSAILIAYDWRWAFMVLIPVTLIVLGLAIGRLKNTRGASAVYLDVPGIIMLIITLTCVTIGVNGLESEQVLQSILSVRVWPYLAVAVIAFGAFIFREQRVTQPFVRLSIFKSRQVTIACFISVGAGMSEAVFVFLPIFASEAFNASDREASLMLLPLVFALAVGAPLSGRLLDKVGAKWIVSSGTLVLTTGMILLSNTFSNTILYYAGTACVGLGLSAILGSAVSYILLNEARQEERTLIQGVSRLFKGFGRLLGGAMIGAVVASSPAELVGYSRAFLLIACAGALLFLLSFGLQSQREEIKARTTPTS